MLLLVQWTPALITHFTHSGFLAHGKGFKSATPGDRYHYIARAVIEICKTGHPWNYTHSLNSLKVKECATPLLGTRRQSRACEWTEKSKRIIRYCSWNSKFSIIVRSKHTFFWLSCKRHLFSTSCCTPIPDPAKLVSMWDMSNNFILVTLWFIGAIYVPKIMYLKSKDQHSVFSLM